MKFWRSILPNFSIALNMALMIVIYLDMRNPKMGFLADTPFYVLAIAAAITSLISAVTLYAVYRKNRKQ